MLRNNVRHLTRSEALAIMFPGYAGSPEAEAGFPPEQGWDDWCAPAQPLPIDMCVTDLISKGAIGSRTEAWARKIACPYYTTRQAIAHAAANAADDYNIAKRRALAKKPAQDLVKKFEKHTEKTLDLIRLNNILVDSIAGGTSVNGEWHNTEGTKEDMLIFQEAYDTLRKLSVLLPDAAARLDKRRRIAPDHASGDNWNITFVMELDVLSNKLTKYGLCCGQYLSHQFIIAAYASLGGGETTSGTWGSAVNTGNERREKLSVAEREARASGEKLPEREQRAAEAKGSLDEWKTREARTLVAEALGGKMPGMIATRYYAEATPRMKTYIDALGWTVAHRAAHPVPTE